MLKITLFDGLSDKVKVMIYGKSLKRLEGHLRDYLEEHRFEVIGFNDEQQAELFCQFTYTPRKDLPHKIYDELQEYLDISNWEEMQFDPEKYPKHRYYEFSWATFRINTAWGDYDFISDSWEDTREEFIKQAAKRGKISVVYQEEWDRVFNKALVAVG
jgi:hypothetical protein